MPAVRQVPKTSDFLAAWEAGLRGERGVDRNARRGGVYDLVDGPSALLWAQEAARDRALFLACYADGASGEDLERVVSRRYGVVRVQDDYGVGTALLQRPAGTGAGTVYRGTRIEVLGSGPFPRVYAVADDVPVGASDLAVSVPVRATRTGAGVQVSTSNLLRVTDELFDASLAPVSLTCADGTEREDDAALLARGRAGKQRRKVGTPTAVTDACLAVGAANVVVLDANVFGDDLDFGVTHVYVADAGFQSPDSLVDACYVALEGARVEGCDAAVLGMVNTPVTDLRLTVTLSDVPARFDLAALTTLIVSAELDDFNARSDFWTWSLASVEAVASDAGGDAVRQVSAASAQAPGTPAFVAVLPRFTLAGAAIKVEYLPPS